MHTGERLFSQNTSKDLDYRQYYRAAEKYFHRTDASNVTDSLAYIGYNHTIQIITGSKRVSDTLLDCYIKSGILALSAGEGKTALTHFSEAIRLWHQLPVLNDTLLFLPYLYTGAIYYDLNRLDSASGYYKKAEAVLMSHPGLNESERLYNKFGALYYETGDYQKSAFYFQKAFALEAARKTPNVFFIVNYKNNIGTAFMKMKNYEAARKIFTELLPYKIGEDQLYSNIGTSFMEQGNTEEAIRFFKSIKNSSPDKLNSLTRVYLMRNDLDSANYYNQELLSFFSKQPSQNKSAGHGLAFKYAADIFEKMGAYSKAVQNYQMALVQYLPGFEDTAYVRNPTLFNGLQNFSFLFDALNAKARALQLLFRKMGKLPDLETALSTYDASLRLARHVEKTYSSDEARLFLKEKVNPACGNGIDIAMELYRLTGNKQYASKAFGYAESNKSSVLQAALQKLELTKLPGLPEQLLEAEKSYKGLLAKLSIQQTRTGDAQTQHQLQKEIQEASLALASVQEKLEEIPAYHNLKFNQSFVNPDSLQISLAKKNSTVLCYYYTNTQLLCFYANSTEQGVVSNALPGDFLSLVNNLRQQLEYGAAGDRKSINGISQKLYKYLIEPVKAYLKNSRHLVIIPYNEINFVPFEMLRADNADSYLLAQFAISYNYSANFLFDKSILHSGPYEVLAMAPFAYKENKQLILPALPASASEIAGLHGLILTGRNAGKGQFITMASKFPVIHLATHAVASDKDPLGCYIEFFGDRNSPDSTHRLYENEIYNLDLKSASLVILSACETGKGQLLYGEGVESLSRAFSYAGCKSVITSLWKADDASTAFIMKKLHYYLGKSYSKDEALQQAKLDYLNSSEVDDRYKSPFYWAHLELIGAVDPAKEPQIPWLYICAGVVVLLIFFYVLKRKKYRIN
jgi:CHAT domain-containing protein/Tfp pilus assembly protein PilF